MLVCRESRVDLRQDGHFHHIQVFELSTQDKEFDERNGDAIVPVDAFAEKASRKGRPSKSPSRGRSRSVKRDPSTPRRARSTSRKTKSDSSSDDKAKSSAPTVVDLSSTASSTVESSTVVTESIFNSSKSFAETTTTTTVDGTQADDEGDDSDSVFNSSSSAPSIPADVDNSVVSDAVADLVKQGWLVQAVGILVVCLAMLGHILVPHIEANIPMSQEVKTVVLILTKTNSLPPLVTLALVLRGQNNRGLSKWIAICLVWRTAAEVILQLPDPKSLYLTMALLCVGVADMAGLVALGSAVGGSHPDYDVFTQTLCSFGFALLVMSDRWESLVRSLVSLMVRQPLMSVFLSMSSILAEV
ncbi:hypothetical protein DYB32_009156 [Aphanomyces invadans]|uniref:Uncharacterized protein n=1 Tax=Aphanomyces invadans TaxID=157072 RepID=A0A418AJM4_9STRA|nr:hypothetical protein DYB32_009156 [Aphanomyces invadans]